ncbi:FMN-binding negative transcriptional regulator [Endozoicomonas sp. SM1973]|uniref:FMN-binding negative transcriptional regulator n=1 Tax=Spartinivicinus marinus TaxID=2994442 RepID=A0A853IDY0_9GAMM|nr:FMN-binding negative transcriptional regulator [Spartinivicinus marinus]MCX4029302.1 FMN-binding negative transcriptional regulator [Spartinivicinus marinus]NYZ68141.1 FMN-binding negative transcriptional regulator [Spartinivicinus marinus]
MFIPKAFEQNDTESLIGLMREYPFATLITVSEAEGIEANPMPLSFIQDEDKQYLQGHIAKANSLWKSVNNGSEVLVVFNGPNGYISPNYYPTKQETGKAVPTWNYVTVHVSGRLSFIHDADWNRAMIDRLTVEHEAAQKTPWTLNDAPEGYIERMLQAIIGVNVEIFSIIGKWKLSQNQSEKNRNGVINGLLGQEQCDANVMASWVNAAKQ